MDDLLKNAKAKRILSAQHKQLPQGPTASASASTTTDATTSTIQITETSVNTAAEKKESSIVIESPVQNSQVREQPKPEPSSVPKISLDTMNEIDDALKDDDPSALVFDFVEGKETELQQRYNYNEQAEQYEDEVTKVLYLQLHKLAGKLEDVVTQNELLDYLDAHPELDKILQPQDIGLMVEGLRRRYGIIRTSKSDTKKKKAAKTQQVDAFADGLGDIGL